MLRNLVCAVLFAPLAYPAFAATLVNPFFDTTNAAHVETVCTAYARQGLKCKPGEAFYFFIDHEIGGRPLDSAPIKNDTGFVIKDLHLEILAPGKYQVDQDQTTGKATVKPDPNGNITQPDGTWDKGRSNTFKSIKLSDDKRTIDFKDPKEGDIAKNANFVDGKEYPAAAIRLLVKSSFSVAEADAKSEGKSVRYDAASKTLTFADDLITQTGDPVDPVIGSEVLPPAFQLAGTLGSNVSFFATSPLFTIHNGSTTYFTGELELLTYSIPKNEFSGTVVPISIAGAAPDSLFFDSALPDVTSAFLAGIDQYLNPNSSIFDGSQRLFYTVHPDANFLALTNQFSTSAESFLTNRISLVPEPSSPLLLIIALFALTVAGAGKGNLRDGVRLLHDRGTAK